MLEFWFWRHCGLPSWTLWVLSFIWNHAGPPMPPFDSITRLCCSSNNINSLPTNWSLRCNRRSTIIFWFPFSFHLEHTLAGDIPSMFLCVFDARIRGQSCRFVVDLWIFFSSRHSCHMICLSLSEPIDPLGHWPHWFAYSRCLCSPNRLGGRAKRKQFCPKEGDHGENIVFLLCRFFTFNGKYQFLHSDHFSL